MSMLSEPLRVEEGQHKNDGTPWPTTRQQSWHTPARKPWLSPCYPTNKTPLCPDAAEAHADKMCRAYKVICSVSETMCSYGLCGLQIAKDRAKQRLANLSAGLRRELPWKMDALSDGLWSAAGSWSAPVSWTTGSGQSVIGSDQGSSGADQKSFVGSVEKALSALEEELDAVDTEFASNEVDAESRRTGAHDKEQGSQKLSGNYDSRWGSTPQISRLRAESNIASFATRMELSGDNDNTINEGGRSQQGAPGLNAGSDERSRILALEKLTSIESRLATVEHRLVEDISKIGMGTYLKAGCLATLLGYCLDEARYSNTSWYNSSSSSRTSGYVGGQNFLAYSNSNRGEGTVDETVDQLQLGENIINNAQHVALGTAAPSMTLVDAHTLWGHAKYFGAGVCQIALHHRALHRQFNVVLPRVKGKLDKKKTGLNYSCSDPM